ncbi:MAG: patatin-like phospholipase family protein [Elusimicrobia bacterium]|nr:patatin-like phospholipase family protein [Elusimicrobiota bacterium]
MTLLKAALCAALLCSPAAAAPDLSEDALLRDHLFRQLVAMSPGQRPKVGLVFSAGSLRATAHVGVASVLENAGFPVDVVAGTSMGAIMGALYAGGTPIKKLREIAKGIKLSSGTNLNAFTLIRYVLADKLLSSAATEAFIHQQLGGMRFEDLKKPFACVAADLYSGEAIIFREGDLALAVRASMNLPGIFAPVEYRHRYLVDGGVVDYIPIDAARLLGAQWVLASVTEADYTHSKPSNVFQSLEQVVDIRGSLLSREQRRQADFLIEPPVGDIGMYETARSKEAIDKGVLAANKLLPSAMEKLILFSMDSLLKDYFPRPAVKRP